MPGIMRYISYVVSSSQDQHVLTDLILQKGWPSWIVRILAEGTENLRVNYIGRQQIDLDAVGLKSP